MAYGPDNDECLHCGRGAMPAHTRELSRLAAAYREAWEAERKADDENNYTREHFEWGDPRSRSAWCRLDSAGFVMREAQAALLAHARGER